LGQERQTELPMIFTGLLTLALRILATLE